MIVVKRLNDLILECSRDDCPTVYLVDAERYAEIARGKDENARWRLIKANCIATRTKKEE